MGDVIKNAPFKKGDGRKKGRPPGMQNVRTQVLKDAMLLAADQVGEIAAIVTAAQIATLQSKSQRTSLL